MEKPVPGRVQRRFTFLLSMFQKESMDAGQIVVLLGIGLAAGAASGLLGIGGGILIIPGLVFLLGFSQKMAQGTSLTLLALPIGLLGVMNYYKAGFVDIKAALFMAVTFVIGSYFTSKIVADLPELTVKRIFAVFLFLYAMKLFFNK
ncbi:MAG: hypothetical protein FMNOHCHN_03104 [Ignavibacteriaceae bacterium]|nr:hypothetical protein [Ignavibacteriaceae bacterium]